MDKKKIVIKKYENRRMYDITHSRYVNLDEVARAVQDGHDIQVVDAASGEDITRVVMTQIITECAKAPDSVFPLDILREMVIASGKATQESALNYMRTVAELYKDAWQGFSHTMSPFDVMRQMMNSPAAQPAGSKPAEVAGQDSGVSRTSKTEDAKEDSELQELKRRLRDLESRVSKDSNRPAARKKATRTRSKP